MPNGETVLYLEVPSYSYIQIDGGMLYFDSYAIEGNKETRVDQFAIRKDIAEKPVVDEPTTDAPVVDEPTTESGDVITENPVIPDTSTTDNSPIYVIAFMLVSVGAVVFTFRKKKRTTKV